MATYDRIDRLITYLGGAVPEVVWEREAADVARPDDWGAVELRTTTDSTWADGDQTDTAWAIDVYLCVTSQEAGWADRIGAALHAYDDNVAWISWQMAERAWHPEIQKTLWRWRVTLWEPLTGEEAG